MLHGRGLLLSSRAIGIGRRRLDTASIRSFSASTGLNGTLRSTLQPSRGSALGSRISTRVGLQPASSILRNGTAIRFKSTEAASPAATSTADTLSPEALSATSSNLPEWASKTSDVSLSNTPDLDSINILDIPERIGYLKELGLDYGWGPTSFMEFFLEHVHVYSGMPWWGSIITTTLVVRLVFFKLFMDASDNAGRLATISHLTKPIMEKQKVAMARSDTAEVMRLRSENSMIMNRAGVKMWKSFAPMISIFTGYGTFVLLRAMANIPVPGLEDGGILWFQNLAIADPYYILPVITSGVLHIAIKSGGETGSNTMSQTAVRAISYILPGISLIFTSFMPAGLQLSFLFTGVFTSLQGALFRRPSFRARFGLQPLPGAAPTPSPSSGSSATPTYQSRVITVKPNAEGSWEAPRSSSSSSKSKPKSILDNLSKNVEETVGAIKSSHKSTVKRANEMMGRSAPEGAALSKRDRKIVSKIEGQRRVEEAMRRARYDKERLARRRERKMGDDE